MAVLFGGGEVGRDIAALILKKQNGLPVGNLAEEWHGTIPILFSPT
jgi:hypothetical protein